MRLHSLVSLYSSSSRVFMSGNENETLRCRRSTMMCAKRVVTKQLIVFCWRGRAKIHSSACAIHTCICVYVCIYKEQFLDRQRNPRQHGLLTQIKTVGVKNQEDVLFILSYFAIVSLRFCEEREHCPQRGHWGLVL